MEEREVDDETFFPSSFSFLFSFSSPHTTRLIQQHDESAAGQTHWARFTLLPNAVFVWDGWMGRSISLKKKKAIGMMSRKRTRTILIASKCGKVPHSAAKAPFRTQEEVLAYAFTLQGPC